MYDTAVTLSPNNVRLWNEQANAYLATGDRETGRAPLLGEPGQG